MGNLIVNDVNDISLDGRSFRRTTGVEYIAALVSNRLNTIYQEWEVDQTIGIPWLTTFLDKGVPRQYVDQVIRSTIESTFGVNAVTSFSSSYDRATRKITYSFTANTIYGILTGGN